MILTGKAKEDFDRYIYSIRHMYDNSLTSQKYALIIEWFDSFGVYINTRGFSTMSNKVYFEYSVNKTNYNNMENTRQEATKQAIIKANEIYNSLD